MMVVVELIHWDPSKACLVLLEDGQIVCIASGRIALHRSTVGMIGVAPEELMQECHIGKGVKCWETNIHRSHEERLPNLLGQHRAEKEKIEITLTLRKKLTEPTSCDCTHSSNVMTTIAKAKRRF